MTNIKTSLLFLFELLVIIFSTLQIQAKSVIDEGVLSGQKEDFAKLRLADPVASLVAEATVKIDTGGGHGSGVVIGKDCSHGDECKYYVTTNKHVIYGDPKDKTKKSAPCPALGKCSSEVKFSTGETGVASMSGCHQGEVIKKHPKHDLLMMEFSCPKNSTPINPAPVANQCPKPGDELTQVGFPSPETGREKGDPGKVEKRFSQGKLAQCEPGGDCEGSVDSWKGNSGGPTASKQGLTTILWGSKGPDAANPKKFAGAKHSAMVNCEDFLKFARSHVKNDGTKTILAGDAPGAFSGHTFTPALLPPEQTSAR